MAHCININSPEYITLAQQTKLGQRELKARIAAWQEINQTYNFPSIEQVEGLLDSNPELPFEEFQEDKYLAEILPNIDNLSIKESFSNIKSNNKASDLVSIKKDYNTLYNGSSTERSYTNAFINVFDAITSDKEKYSIFNKMKESGVNSFEKLSNMYEDYLSYPEGYTNFDWEVRKVFDRIINTGEALNSKGSLLQSYIQKTNSSSNSNDLKTYNEIGGRLLVSHKNKSKNQLEGAIQHAVTVLKRGFSDRVEVKVSQTKDSKNGKQTIVYVEKPVANIVNSRDYTQKEFETLQANKQHLFGDSNVSTAREILTKLGDPLAQSLLRNLPKEDIPITLVDSMTLSGRDYNFSTNIEEASAIYNPSSNSIVTALSGVTGPTLKHEIVHALSVQYIKNNKDNAVVKKFEELFNTAKEELQKEDWYALSDIYEFISETISNKRFKNRMKEINTGENNRNLFQKVIDAILEFFGITPKGKYKSLYQEAFSTAANILQDNYAYVSSRENMYADVYSKEELEKLNEEFGVNPSPVQVSNSPYTQALKRLNTNYSLQEIKDLSSVLTTSFSDLVSWHQEGNTELTREEIISWLTPAKLFEETKEQFELDIEDYIDQKQPQKYIDNLNKLLDNFYDLAMMATPEINFIEGLKFSQNDLKTYQYNLKEELDNGSSQSTDMESEVEFHEMSVVDGWMKNFKFTSVNDSLTNKIKRVLRSINELDKNGNPVKDSIGYHRKLSLDAIKNDLLRELQNVITSKDLLPALGIMAKSKPWTTSIIKALKEDNELYSQFYSVFKKDFTKHSIVTTTSNSEGVISYKSPVINQSNDFNLWMEDWRNTLESRIIYNNNYSVYNTDGTLNIKNIENNIKILQELIKEWNTIVKQNNVALRKDFLTRKGVTLKNQLNAIGIGLSGVEVKDLFQDILVDISEVKELFGVTKSDFNLDIVLNKLVLTNSWAKNNINKEGINSLSLIQENSSNFGSIARIVSQSLEDLIEGSVHENGKSYYTYLQPSYLSKITKQLKNVKGNIKEFNEFIDKEFRQYEGTLVNPDGTFNISWLNDLTDKKTGASKRELFDHKVVLNFNKSDYDALTPADYQTLLMVEYFTGKDTAWYHVPILAEAPSAEFIKFDKISLNYKENISERLLDLFTYEYNRIKTVRARKEGIENGNIKAINNYDKNGENFHFLTFLNDYIDVIDSIVDKQGNYADTLPSELFNFIKETIQTNLDSKANTAIDYINELGLLEKSESGKYLYLNAFGINSNNLQDKLTEYFYNSYFATANIIQLTSTDLSYYKNVEDFQKRNKEIHAPGTMVNTQAMYNNQRIGKDTETYIILKDLEQSSSNEVLDYIKSVFDVNPLLSKVEKESIFNKYYNNNVTDAQAYRSLESAKTVIAMSTGWNDSLEASYQRLKRGQWDIKDYNNIMQAFKPFVYTQTTVDSGILLDANDPSKGNRMIKVPVQHKNSESLLLPMLGMQFKSPKLRGMMQAMNDHQIDVIMFDSAVKVGLQGVLDINDMQDRKQISNYIGSFKNDNQIFKIISYEDYKIQQPIPEHLQDTSQLFGTQLRKLVISDIATDAIFNIKGTSLDKEQITNLYNRAIIDNVIASYQGLIQDFGNEESLQVIIENELINNTRYSKDLLNAAQLDSNGKFVLPLFDPSQSGRIQQLLNSIWKSRITKQRIKGGKAVQMSSFGLSDDLELKFHIVDGKVAIKYMECYLPFWSEKMPKGWEASGFIDINTGIMDVNKMLKSGIIDEEFLEAIAYRIPTEDKYSMWPLKVKGFLPRNAGGNIILPREITTITGSDFDIDSMYMMLKEFNFNEETGKFETITPDMTKDTKDMSTEERNNLLMDIMRGILSHPDTASKQLNPGNFDGPKMTARRLNILASGANYSWRQLERMSLDELDKISNKSQLDILDFTTQISLHKQNMTAAKLIGIIANHSTNHAIRQNTNIELSPLEIVVTDKETGEKSLKTFNRFKLNGRFLTSLHDIINPTQTAYISKNYASFLAASVDAVKDPVLSFFNLNTFTADSAMLLTGLGYSFDEIGLLLRQPVIEELISYYDKNNKAGMTKVQAVENLLYKYKTFLNETLNTPVYSDMYEANSNNFISEKMAEMISTNAKLKELKGLEGAEKEAYIKNNYGDIQELYKYQYQVLLNYQSILDTAQKLADFVSAAKADTGNGGAGPTIADTKFKMRKILKHIENSNPQFGKPTLLNADVVEFVDPKLFNNIEGLRDHLRKSPLGFIQGFTTLGLQSTEYVLSKYFPQYQSYFDYIFNQLEDNYLKNNKLSVELMNQLYTEFFAYYMSQFEDFSFENANKYIYEFPKKFLELKNKDEELKNLQIIKNIQYINHSDEVPVAKLKFRAGGRLSSNVRDIMIMEWESLLYKPQYRELALDLFKYNFYINGFGFGTTSFIHLAPAALKIELPNFTSNLNKLMSNEENDRFSTSQLNIFIDQFYRNHLGSKKLVPETKSIKQSEITDENGKVFDTLDLRITRKTHPDLYSSKGTLLTYFTVDINGNKEYFKVTDQIPDINNKIITTIENVQPVGIRNNFLEFDFNNINIKTKVASGNVNDRSEYTEQYQNASMSQEGYDYEYNPEPANQKMSEEMAEHYQNAFEYIQEENTKFKPLHGQAFEALSEEDIPAYIRDSYNSISNNDISNSPDFSDAFQSLINEVGKDNIEESKNKCK